MKKILIAIIILLLLFTILVFAFVPSKIVITSSKVVGTTSDGFDTSLHKLENWEKWWPAKSFPPANDSVFVYDGFTYKLTGLFTDGGAVQVRSGDLSVDTRIQTITKDRDSITAEWVIVLPSGINPFTRLSRYLKSGALRKSSQTVFDSLCHFAGKTENIYGFRIERTTFREVTLLACRFKTTAYPTIDNIYNTINKLRQYLASHKATEKYFPMVNTKQVDSLQYETMVAISIEREIPVRGDFIITRMVPMEDRFLSTEARGGESSIKMAHDAIKKYMSHRSLSSPARPFDILVTDRSKETDTTKWKTLIFYPSM